MASEKEMLRFCEVTGAAYEESAHHKALDGFCEALTDAYLDSEGTKWEELMSQLQERLGHDIFNELFGERF